MSGSVGTYKFYGPRKESTMTDQERTDFIDRLTQDVEAASSARAALLDPYRSMAPVSPKPAPYREPASRRLAVLLGFLAGPTAFAVALCHLDWSDNHCGPAVGLLMYGLVCYVVAGVTVLFEDMGAAQFKDFTTRQRALAFAWAPAFFLCYVARRSYRWVRYGSDP